MGSGSFYWTIHSGGSVGALLVPMDTSIGTSNITIDCWFKLGNIVNASSETQYLFRGHNNSTGETSLSSRWIKGGGYYTLVSYFNGRNVNAVFSSYDQAWHHFALERYNGSLYVYLDGSIVGSETHATFGGSFNMLTDSLRIGFMFTGYLDEFRIILSAAYMGQSFTPPTQPYA
jgi:hypothetical protein